MNIETFNIFFKYKKFQKALADFISDLSIKTRLMFCFIAFSVFLVSTIGLISYSKSSDIIYKQSTLYSDTILRQVVDRTEKLKKDIMNISIPLMINPLFQNNDFKSLDYSEFSVRKRAIESNFNTIMTINKDICSIYMCIQPDTVFSSSSVSSKDEANFESYVVNKSYGIEISIPVWIGIHENEFQLDTNRRVFTFSRTFYEKVSYKSFATLVINIPEKVLDDIASPALNDSRNNIYIIDSSGGMFYDSNGVSDSKAVEREYFKNILNGNETEKTFSYKTGTSSYVVKSIRSEDEKWIYIAEVPLDYILQNSSQIRKYLTGVLAVSLALSVFAAYWISSYFTVPLRKMAGTMKIVEKGNFDVSIGIRNKSEIGELSGSFDNMTREIKNLITKLDFEHLQKRKEELNTLQAQITPHFLYNSLNAIKCLARIQKADGIEEMTTSLIELLRMTISKKNLYIKVGEEIEMVKHYLMLQKLRYGDRFSVKFECDEEVLDYMTIKMVLQPLVENVIFHGIEAGKADNTIIIRGYLKDSSVYMEVEDNGVGMDEKQIWKILYEESSNEKKYSGIGVKNVNERIKMHFGQEYGLSFKSIPGSFTIATVTIPIFEENEAIQNV